MFGAKKQKASGKQSLIGSDATLNGDLIFDGDCFIDGTIEGDVSTGDSKKAYLSISQGGCVKGNVSVPVLDLSGRIEGDVHASGKVIFGASAKVTGNVHYNLIEIAAGAEINGQLIHEEAGREPDSLKSYAAEPSSMNEVAAETAR